MKKIWIGIVNIIVMILVVVFVIIYTNLEHDKIYKSQIETFEATAIRMNNMTENYLKSEQDIVDNWANYINSKELDINEALEFTAISKKSAYASVHIIYKDSLMGLSTSPSIKDSTDYNVSYKEISLFDNLDWISDNLDSINVSRAYTNPINASQSMALCRGIKLKKESDIKDAYLLRVIPVSIIIDKWLLTQEGADNIELSLIDKSGNYIIKDTAYKNTNFFEFYKSYNNANSKDLDNLKETIINNDSGTIEMYNSVGKLCIIAHTPVKTVGGWVLLSYIESDNLKVTNDNWVLVGVISAGLLILFVIDLIYLRHFYMKLKYLSHQADLANKSKTDFLSTMSHDIRTPMNAIVGLTVLTEKNIDNKELVKEYNKKIALASNHLLTLINDILDISKVESGKINLNPASFSIRELLENLLNITEPMIKNKNIEFKCESQISYEYLYADKLRLNQIFINILSNAIKYTNEFGKVTLDLIEEDNNEYVKLIYIVSDTGIGMSKEFMEKMYEPFIRETDSRINTIEGTGLGLAITKKMVDLMEGNIECESEVGKGTTFKITLNIKKDLEHDNKKVNNLSNDYSDIANMNILIAEDNDINYEIISEMLKMYNINTVRAIDGLECLNIIKESKENEYDLIFMDIQMPRMNGLDTTKNIRLLDNWAKNIPIIAMTADAFSENINECLSVGMNGHIAKPIDLNIVLKEIRKIKELRK